MTSNPGNIVTLSLKELLDNNDKYIIPIYQRNYAWGETEIAQLIQDVIDYLPVDNFTPSRNYYLGTLVVFERLDGYSPVFETIDGQQRLTTLSIITSYIRTVYKGVDLTWFNKLNLDFDSRKNSTFTLKSIYNGQFSDGHDYNESLRNGYELIGKILPIKLIENNLQIEKFCEYFFEKVKILRVPVPEGTDLNHYFEIMNNRGEQLEKHEILKSKLLKILNPVDDEEINTLSASFNMIWEACSNMEKFVQYGFDPSQRNALFGNNHWNQFSLSSFDEVCIKLAPSLHSRGNQFSKLPISEIILGKSVPKMQATNDENPDRFNSVINFPNFLLHVLRIQTKKNIALDDKRLLKLFEDEIDALTDDDKVPFVKNFAFNLLKCKFLFDKYIIKREFIAGLDKWSLKCLKWYDGNKVSYINTFGDENNESERDDNRKLLMLLSMFHVSTPTMVYKHWLNAALYYVFYQREVTSDNYIKYLEWLANSFLFHRYISKEPLDYYDIIFKEIPKNENLFNQLALENLTYGKIVNNLIFNYLDYLLWKEIGGKIQVVKSYEFTFRSSVEHYYPQHPMDGYDELEPESLHSFGNLCLISHNKNSRLSYLPPKAKRSYYPHSTFDSIKQYVMMNDYDPEEWGPSNISDHNTKMINLFLRQLDSYQSGRTMPNLHSEIENEPRRDKSLKWFDEFQLTDPFLLARALMCFGAIDEEVGWTSGGSKWNFLLWDRIRKSEAYISFSEFIKNNNPTNLEEIIASQLKNSQELREESYRYVFVKYPEILEYCSEGNFGWVNDGAKIILMQGSRAGSSNSYELYIFMLNNYILTKYKIKPYRHYDRLFISIDDTTIPLKIIDFSWDNEVRLEIWNDSEKQICCGINTQDLHGNSRIVKHIKELGWEINSRGLYTCIANPYFLQLADDIEYNIGRLRKEFDKLVGSLTI